MGQVVDSRVGERADPIRKPEIHDHVGNEADVNNAVEDHERVQSYFVGEEAHLRTKSPSKTTSLSYCRSHDLAYIRVRYLQLALQLTAASTCRRRSSPTHTSYGVTTAVKYISMPIKSSCRYNWNSHQHLPQRCETNVPHDQFLKLQVRSVFSE